MKITNLTTGDSRTMDGPADRDAVAANIARLTVLAGHPIGVNRADIAEAAVTIVNELPAVMAGDTASIGFADAMNLLSLDVTA